MSDHLPNSPKDVHVEQFIHSGNAGLVCGIADDALNHDEEGTRASPIFFLTD